jgi:hypothetical protein
LTITSTPQGRFVYWKGLEPFELLEYNSRLVAFMQELPFQEGKPVSPIYEGGEGSTELLEYSHTADNSSDHQVYMASLRNTDDDEPGPECDGELLEDVSADERMAEAPQDENQEHRRIQWLKNAKRAQCRWNVENHGRNPMLQRNLNNAFAAAVDREYRTPIGTIAEVSLLTQQLPPNPQIQRLQYLTQRTLVRLDGQHPVSSTRNMPSRSELHGDTAQISRTLGGGPGYRRKTITSATRASSPCVATSNKRCSNPLNHLATGAIQGLKAKLHPRPASRTLPRSILGRRSMMAATRGASSRKGEGTVPTGTTMMTITTASPPSPLTSLRNPTPRI